MNFDVWKDEKSSRGREAYELFASGFSIQPSRADIEHLGIVVSAFSNLPYENLTKIIKKFTARSDTERLRGPVEVISGYLEKRTGGTCFSLTYCLGSMLSSAGFHCYPVMADMRRPNIHCALVVEMTGKRYLVDPGYLVGEPVELSGKIARIETPFGMVELRPRMSESYDLFTLHGGWDEFSELGAPFKRLEQQARSSERKWRYTVRTVPVSHAEFMRHWQESFSLPMMNNLLLTRLTREGHLYVKNHHLRVRGVGTKKNENIRSDMETRIATEFGIPHEIVEEALQYIRRLKATWRREDMESERANF